MSFAEEYVCYINQYNYFVIHNHIKLTKMEPELAEGELTICRDSMNPNKTLHGGAHFTLADCVASAAARSNKMNYVTVNSSFEYIRPVMEGTVHAVARVRHRGRTICRISVELTDGRGRLLSEGKFTMYCTGKPFKMD